MADEKAGWQRTTQVVPPAAQQIDAILARALPGRGWRACEPLAGGLSNANFRVTLDGPPHAVVLRVYQRDPAACARETDLLRFLAGRVPAPAVLYASADGIAPATDIGPHAVLHWIDGVTFRDLKARGDRADIADAARAVGETLARLQAITFPGAGPIEAGMTIGPPFIDGPHPLPTFIERCLDAPAMAERLPPARREAVRAFIWRWAPRLDALDNDRQLVHADFNAPNILVDRRHGRWDVSGLLDWEFAFSGSSLFDVGNFLRYERRARPLVEPHFSHAFRASGGLLPDDWRTLARAVDLTALCELLARPSLAPLACADLVELVAATVEDRDPE